MKTICPMCQGEHTLDHCPRWRDRSTAEKAGGLSEAIMALRCTNPYPEDNCNLYKEGYAVARQEAADLARARSTGNLCVGCEGRPSAGNTPCAVCNLPAIPEAGSRVLAKVWFHPLEDGGYDVRDSSDLPERPCAECIEAVIIKSAWTDRSTASGAGDLPAVDQATVDQATVDKHLDAVLRASGSALRHYNMQKTLDGMRAAMQAAMVRPTANGAGGQS